MLLYPPAASCNPGEASSGTGNFLIWGNPVTGALVSFLDGVSVSTRLPKKPSALFGTSS